MGRALKVVDKVCSVTFNSLRPDGLYPARLLCSWDSLGKNTGVGCYALLDSTPRDQTQVSYITCITTSAIWEAPSNILQTYNNQNSTALA